VLDISSTIKNKIAEFGNLITDFKTAYAEKSLYEFVEYVVNKSGIKGLYNTNSEEDIDRTMNIDQLLQSVKSYEHLNPDANLTDYLEGITLQNTIEEEDDDEKSVSISTIHASKGLEFDYVFIIGLEEGKFPLSRAMDDLNEMEEERRLMYVAVTRAKKKLYLTRAKSRFMYGSRERQAPSRFIGEMGLKTQSEQKNNYYDEYSSKYNSFGGGNYSDYNSYSSKTTFNSGYSSNRSSTSTVSNSNTKTFQEKFTATGGLNKLQDLMINKLNNQKKSFSDYKVGVKVLHTKFGVGTIVKVDDVGNNNFVSVDFGTIGVKTLSLNFAPLQILK